MDQNQWTNIATNQPSSTSDTLLEESLEEYIRAAYPAIDTDIENNIPTSASTSTSTSSSTPSSSTQQAKTTPARQKPTLKKGHINRILLYNGCFNPPHQGHLAQLTHAYRHSGADLHIVGAVVLVAGDQYLKWKMGRSPSALRLSVAQRIELWNRELRARERERDGSAADRWCWVIPEDKWSATADELERLFEMDGFEVEFVRLAGGDKVGLRGVEHGVWGCGMTVTTDVSRPVEFCERVGGGGGEVRLRDLPGHTKWKRVLQQGDAVGEDNDAGVRGGAPAQTLASTSLAGYVSQVCLRGHCPPRSYTSTGVSVPSRRSPVRLWTPPTPIVPEHKREVWVCESTYFTRGTYTVRFVTSTLQERLDPNLSSTKLREIITEATAPSQGGRVLEDRLRGVALSPELLAKFITEEMGKDMKE
ncbi:hypothetical protein M434DRAFT_35126 [Hypoxylon sp. CO27-5]|nr:hypothetical protein M434DRAFT_35126 [Hypoxylon sp. CO27-5]